MSDRCAQQMDDLIEGGISERDSLYQEIDQLKAHAVEVLAKTLYEKEMHEDGRHVFRSYEKLREEESLQHNNKPEYRAEARALLGWEE